MALQKSFTTAHGFTAEEAYARITTFSGDKDTISVNVEVHKDVQARTEHKQPISVFVISLALPFGASMTEMYVALMEDSNFIDSQSC
jgi:hypothetical protein